MRSFLGFALMLLTVGMFVILPHELAHYAAMRACGVHVVRFTIGFGPTLWSHVLPDGVEFCIKPLWLGGYTEPAMNGHDGILQASTASRLIIDFAGVTMNALCAALLLLPVIIRGGLKPTVGYAARIVRLPRMLSAPLLAFTFCVYEWLTIPPRLGLRVIAALRGKSKPRVYYLNAVEQRYGMSLLQKTRLRNFLVWLALTHLFIGGLNTIPLAPFDGGQAAALGVEALLGANATHVFESISLPVFFLLYFIISSGESRASRQRKKSSESV